MFRRSITEKIRGLEKEVEDGNEKALKQLLYNYRLSGKLKEYFQLLSTIRPLKKEEIEELKVATWGGFLQQVRICDAQNKIDESLLEEILALNDSNNLERQKTGIICWYCDHSCMDFIEEKSNFLGLIRFIKQHENCPNNKT